MSLEEFMTGGSEAIKLEMKPVEKRTHKQNRRGCKHENRILQRGYDIRKGAIDVSVCIDCGHNLG